MGLAVRLDIDSLRAFKTVVELGGVTRAANRLNLTQSAVSHKLLRLEERIGRPILIRDATGIAPTADGRSLLSYAERLVSLHDEAALHFTTSEFTGTVRLGATEDAACKGLTAVIGRFGRLHPNVSITVRVAQSLVLQRWLDDGLIDVAVMQVFAEARHSGDVELWRDELLWIDSPDHPTKPGVVVPFVAFDENCFYKRAAREALAAEGRELRTVLECPSGEGVKAGVRHGLGIGVLNRRQLDASVREIHGDLPGFPPILQIARSARRLPAGLERTLLTTICENLP